MLETNPQKLSYTTGLKNKLCYLNYLNDLTANEITKVLSNINNYPNALRNRVMFLITVLAGLRVSEVAGLTIGDVRNADGSIKSEIFLSADRVKHNHARTIFVSTRLQAELAEYLTTKVCLYDAQPVLQIKKPLVRKSEATVKQ